MFCSNCWLRSKLLSQSSNLSAKSGSTETCADSLGSRSGRCCGRCTCFRVPHVRGGVLGARDDERAARRHRAAQVLAEVEGAVVALHHRVPAHQPTQLFRLEPQNNLTTSQHLKSARRTHRLQICNVWDFALSIRIVGAKTQTERELVTTRPHRVRQRITHHAPAHVWGWNPSTIMVSHMHFSVNTTIDIRETHFGQLRPWRACALAHAVWPRRT